MIDEFINECNSFVRIPSVTYFEKPFCDFIYNIFNLNNYKRILNENYLALIPKNNLNNLVLSIHIDRLGLVYNGKDFVYSNYFGYKLYNKDYKPTLLFGERFLEQKVKAYDLDGSIVSVGKVNSCSINKQDNEMIFGIDGIDSKNLESPCPIAYADDLSITNDEIIGQLDNVISVVLAYFLLKANLGYTFLFTKKEEIGKSWEYIYEFLTKRKIGNVITIDTSSIEGYSDFNSTDVVFRASDDIAEYTKNLVDSIVHLANKNRIKYFLKSKNPDKSKIRMITEVGRIIKESNNRFSGASIQFPVIKYHTNRETIKKQSIKVIFDFLITLAEQFDYFIIR